MEGGILTPRTLNRTLLARQLLLRRATLPVWRAVERIGGLQTQYAPSGYIGLWSRLEGFTRPSLTAALERRSVVQATLMRSTIHMVSARDFPRFAAGIEDSRREWWRGIARSRGLESIDMVAAGGVLAEALSSGPRRQADLVAVLEEAGYPREIWEGARLWVHTVRVPPSGTWDRRRADLHALASLWIAVPTSGRAEGLRHLARRYLGAFGPSSPADAATWAGVSFDAMREAMAGMRLTRYRDDEGRELFDAPGGDIVAEETPAPVRFIAHWDAMLLVHARRACVLPEEHRPRIFDTKTPFSFATLLVDGRVCATWREEAGAIVFDTLEPIPRRFRRDVADEGERLAAFMS